VTEPTREQLDNLLDHAHKRRLGPDEVGRIREGIAALRQQVALSQAGASQREALLTEARDALQDAGLRGHGDCWPDITAPILALIAERDRLAAAMQRVRDLHRPWVTVHGTHCNACSHLGVDGTAMVGRVVDMPCPTLRALDTDSAPLTDHQPKEGSA
jgi:hypothetical protein